MKLLHYSHKPIESIHSTAQLESVSRLDKPKGLWVSVEGEYDWKHWCESESFRDCDKQLCYEVLLAEDADILHLSSALDIDCLSERYGVNNRYRSGPDGIDWKRVSQEHHGIIIAPYIWERRLEGGSPWYYGWDCASGCIWDASAIAGFNLENASMLAHAEVSA